MGKKPDKSLIIKVLIESHGLVSPAAKALKVARVTLYKWLEDDEELREVQKHCRESLIDLAESKLFNNVNNGDVTSIIFALKTLGKNRGYIERSEFDVNNNKIINIGATD